VSKYLLAAEADKIQDLIFSSARLREVVGGSQLLLRFCDQVPRLMGISDGNIIMSDAGSFRILFGTEEAARNFGEQLAEVYRLATGGSLTVADPVPVNGNFGQDNKNAEENLRRAKRWRAVWQSQEHFPYMALCSSCGSGLAVTYRSYYPGEEKKYLCRSCLNKGLERPFDEPGEFLREFYQEVIGGSEDLQRYIWPGKMKRADIPEKDPLEDIADDAPRRYVAYLVADGNNMGEVFGACEDEEQMRKLSRGLGKIIRCALAEPTKLLMQNNPRKEQPDSIFIPVLPLILGGDDVFVLLPAPWALDFARRFCRAYEQGMQRLFEEIGLEGVPRPTISAAIIVAKSKYPYYLAHQIGEKRLKEAKRFSKQLWVKGQEVSTLNFEIVVGGRLEQKRPEENIHPTLRPYLVTDEIRENWGLSVNYLIEQRFKLRSIPGKRLAELQQLFDLEELPTPARTDDVKRWQQRLEWLLRRIGRNAEHEKVVREALKVLGSDESHYWREVNRPQESLWHGHGLPDLLEAWDFALDLEKPCRVYEEGE